MAQPNSLYQQLIQLKELKETAAQMEKAIAGSLTQTLLTDNLGIAVRPEFIRIPIQGEICPWTGLSRSEFDDLRTSREIDFYLWPPDSQRPVIHIHLPSVLRWQLAQVQKQKDALPQPQQAAAA